MQQPDPSAPDRPLEETYPEDDETWREILGGRDFGLAKMRSLFLRIPSNPRCKMCASPFGGLGGGVMRALWHAPASRGFRSRDSRWAWMSTSETPGFGVVGAQIEQDFTALEDMVNVAARLGSEAKAGELLFSSEAAALR